MSGSKSQRWRTWIPNFSKNVFGKNNPIKVLWLCRTYVIISCATENVFLFFENMYSLWKPFKDTVYFLLKNVQKCESTLDFGIWCNVMKCWVNYSEYIRQKTIIIIIKKIVDKKYNAMSDVRFGLVFRWLACIYE